MEVLDFGTGLARTAYERHQASIDEIANFLKRHAETSENSTDCRRDPRFPQVFNLYEDSSNTL